MKKAIALLTTAVIFVAYSITAMGKLPSVGYVLVDQKTMVDGQCVIMMDFNL
jgi:hypothetical protein